jgi:hypothetical protein
MEITKLIFLELPDNFKSYDLYWHLKKLEGAKITSILSDYEEVSFIFFDYRNIEFQIFHMGAYRSGRFEFSVKDKNCSDSLLNEITEYFQQLLKR